MQSEKIWEKYLPAGSAYQYSQFEWNRSSERSDTIIINNSKLLIGYEIIRNLFFLRNAILIDISCQVIRDEKRPQLRKGIGNSDFQWHRTCNRTSSRPERDQEIKRRNQNIISSKFYTTGIRLLFILRPSGHCHLARARVAAGGGEAWSRSGGKHWLPVHYLLYEDIWTSCHNLEQLKITQ